MEPMGPRRSTLNIEARDKEKEESTEGAVSDDNAEDTDEDSQGPGSNPGLAHLPAAGRPVSRVILQSKQSTFYHGNILCRTGVRSCALKQKTSEGRE